MPRWRSQRALLSGFHALGDQLDVKAGCEVDDGTQDVAVAFVVVKIADRAGATSLSRLLAAIDWVVRNRSRGDLNIRVLNLAIGAEALGSYTDDPVAFAVERAWQHGIVVVVAAGNGGHDSAALDSPAFDPYVVAVGAQDMLGTVTREDDVVADFSSRPLPAASRRCRPARRPTRAAVLWPRRATGRDAVARSRRSRPTRPPPTATFRCRHRAPARRVQLP